MSESSCHTCCLFFSFLQMCFLYVENLLVSNANYTPKVFGLVFFGCGILLLPIWVYLGSI